MNSWLRGLLETLGYRSDVMGRHELHDMFRNGSLHEGESRELFAIPGVVDVRPRTGGGFTVVLAGEFWLAELDQIRTMLFKMGLRRPEAD